MADEKFTMTGGGGSGGADTDTTRGDTESDQDPPPDPDLPDLSDEEIETGPSGTPPSGGQRTATDITPGEDLERQSLLDVGVDAAETVASDPTGAAAAALPVTFATPVPGDEVVAGGVLAGAAIADQVFDVQPARQSIVSQDEVPVPAEPGLTGSELQPTEQATREQSELPVSGETTQQRPELPVSGQATRDQPEVPVSGQEAFRAPEIPLGQGGGTAGGQATGTGDAVTPGEFPLPGRDFPADPSRDAILRRRAEQVTVGRERGVGRTPRRQQRGASDEELREILDVDETIGQLEEDSQRFLRREFPTGESAVAGRDTATDQEVQAEQTPEVTPEPTGESLLGQSAGTGSRTPPPPLLDQDTTEGARERARQRPEDLLAETGLDLQREQAQQRSLVAEQTDALAQQTTQATQVGQATQTATQQATPAETVPETVTPTETFVDFGEPTQQQRRRPPQADRNTRRRDEDPIRFGLSDLQFERPVISGPEFVGFGDGDG